MLTVVNLAIGSQPPTKYIKWHHLLSKVKRHGGNIIVQRVMATVPGQRFANITLCVAVSSNDVLFQISSTGPYATEHPADFLMHSMKILALT